MMCFAVAIFLVAVSPFILPIAGIILVYKNVEDARNWKTDSSNEVKEPGIVIAFLKAKKQKVCPLIEYVDEG